MEPFDTVKIKKKGALACFSMPAEETVSMQLFFTEATPGGLHSQTGG